MEIPTEMGVIIITTENGEIITFDIMEFLSTQIETLKSWLSGVSVPGGSG